MKRFIGRVKKAGTYIYSLWAVIFFISMFTAPATAGELYPGADNLKTDEPSSIILAKKTGDGTPKPLTAYEGKQIEAMDLMFEKLNALEKDDSLTLEEKQQKAVEIIQEFRYGPEDEHYFWINDLEGKMLMHPFFEDLIGKVVTDIEDADGKPLFVEILDLVLKDGMGFIYFLWPEPGGEKPVPQVAYVRLFKSWGWVLVTGLELETIEAFILEPGFDVPVLPDPGIDDEQPGSPV